MRSYPEVFQNYFTSVYKERWPKLLSALEGAEVQTPRVNTFEKNIPAFVEGIEIPRGEGGLLGYYIMDPASIEAANTLDVQSDDFVLDMCAAPGGKTLILAEALGKSGKLVANEISESRRERLKKVIQQYIPREVRDHVFVTGKDAGKFALTHKNYFDKILVDAPCSGERHLLENAKELAGWTESRSKKLAQRQYALLTAALLSAKKSGRIVYSTCTISPIENDQVIEELLRRKAGTFEVVKPSIMPMGAESTKYGIQFLPDQCGFGPIYYCILKRK